MSTFERWVAAQCPYTIEYSQRVLDDIRLAVVDAFFSLPRGGAEIGGILLGKYEAGRVSIVDSAPLECEHAFGPSFTLSPSDLTKLEKQLSEMPRSGNARPIGWYHSHTRSEIFLSNTDLEVYNRFFPEPWQVALVLRPHTFDPVRAGFFFRETDGSIHAPSSYREFTLDPSAVQQAPKSQQQPANPPAAEPPRQAVRTPVVHAEPPVQPPPKPGPAVPPPSSEPPRQERVAARAPVPPQPELPRQQPPRHEHLRQEHLRQEPPRTESSRAEPPRQEPPRREQLRQEQLRQDPPRPEPPRQEPPRHERLRQEQLRQDPPRPEPPRPEPPRQEPPRHERLRQEQLRQDPPRPEPPRQEPPRHERRRQEQLWQDSPRPEPSRPESPPQARPEARTPRHIEPPRFLPRQETDELQEASRKPLVFAAVLVLSAVLGAVAYQMRDRWMPQNGLLARRDAPTPASLGLSTVDSGGQLQIRWDRNAPGIRNGSGGLLLIVDGGGAPMAKGLDPAMLQSGAFTYGRQTGQVDVTLTVHQKGGGDVSEAAAYLGPPPDRARSMDNPEIRKQRDALASRAAKLQNDLDEQAAQNKKLEKSLEDMRLEMQRKRMENQIPDGEKK